MSTSPERRTQTLLEALRSQPSVGLSLENAIDEDSRFAANSSPPALHEPRSPDQETSAVANLESHADQTPTPESSIDLRLLEYVSTIDNNLTCAICRCPFIDPVRLACDHIFCQQCVDEALRNQPRDARNCPSCRSPTSSHLFQPVPRAIKHMVDELLVECPHHEDGCDHVTSRGDIVSHVRKYCGYTEVECPDAACQMKVRRKDIERGCLHQMANCDDCGKNLMRNELEVSVFTCPI